MSADLSGKTIVLGVTGGIAAYKAAEICSTLVKAGASVHVVMTEHATRFVGPVTFRALTGNQVITSLWDEPREYEIAHISLPDKADAFLIAPATANILGKIAAGVADDMLSTMVMATSAPVILAPAMNFRKSLLLILSFITYRIPFEPNINEVLTTFTFHNKKLLTIFFPAL